MARAAISRLDELCRLPAGAEPSFLGWEETQPLERRVPDPVSEGVALAAPVPVAAPAERGKRADHAELAFLDLHEVAALVRARSVSPVELCELALDRVGRFDAELGAFITVTAELATARAAAAEREIAAGDYRGPLHGVPISLKDLFSTAGIRTTRGSRLYEDFVPKSNATAWERLADQGAVLVGKNNMMEFAMAAEVGNERWGVTRNPWDLARTAHGSSSGSAVAVATGMAYASVASETGASIQRPASFCGVVGMKPSYGRISRSGVAPTSWSMDHVGVLTRSVLDAAIVLEAMVGHDPLDATTRPGQRVDWSSRLGSERRLREIRLGVPRRHIEGHVDDEVEAAFWAAVEEFRSAGATVVDVDPPALEYAATTAVTLRTAEACAHHAATLRRTPEGYSDALRRQLEQGMSLTAVDYLQAQRARRVIGAEMSAVFGEIDLLLSPTTPTAATLIEDGMQAVRDRPWEVGPHQYNVARVFSLLGFPVLSLPCGYTRSGLPISLQIGGRRWEETTLLAAAREYEHRTHWLRPPPTYA